MTCSGQRFPALRRALGAFPTGVTVVTAQPAAGRPVGVTINSFSSVSLEPPLVLWCLAQTAPSRPSFLGASHFAIHVLAQDQAHVSRRFCAQLEDRFDGLAVAAGLGGAPLLDGVAARFECASRETYTVGDHTVFIGEIERYAHAGLPPLVFCGSGYAELRQ
jgi:flavin reductase (DIM6/NTAB) family NADH-FMN oxidoreductase RutF